MGEIAIALVSTLFIVEVFLVIGRRVAKPLLGKDTSTKLTFSAHGKAGLTRIEVVWVLCVLIGKTVLGPVMRSCWLEEWASGGVGITSAAERRKRGIADGQESKGSMDAISEVGRKEGSAALRITGPELRVEVPIHITKADIDAFLALLTPDMLAATVEKSRPLLALFLSAVSSPAQLLLLAKRQCPIKPLGAVNVRNRFEVLKPRRCRDLWTGECRVATAKASLGEDVRTRKRGLEFNLIIEISVGHGSGGKDGQEMVFRQVFTVLQLQKHRYPVEAPKEAEVMLNDDTKKLPFRLGKKDPGFWAALCKDYNPIHISGIAAKLFGLPGRIAHGNCVVAKALAVQDSQEQSRPAGEVADQSMFMEVEFKRPITVPAKVEAVMQRDGGKSAFRVMRNEKVHIEGQTGSL